MWTIDHDDLMKSRPDQVIRFAQYLGVSCPQRDGENDKAYWFRYCAAIIRALKKMRSVKITSEKVG
jgi:hypothetical protein